jgi:3-hydroxyisobutyrate dehydrogenase
MTIAFIGTGNMGLPMLTNLLKKGFSALAYDIVPAALDRAVAAGAGRAGSLAEAASAGDMVITILPSSGNVEAAYLGTGGILENARPGRLCIDMSTIDPGTSQRVAARLAGRSIRFIDAPVSGGVGGATAGTLAIMVGGAPGDVEEAMPALSAMGANIIHVGAVGAGEVAKLCNNLIAGVAFAAVSEAFRIGEGFGLDPKVLTRVIATSSGATWVMERNHPVPGVDPNSSANRDYEPGFMTDLMAKDLGLAVNAAREKRVPVAVAAAAMQIYRMASAHGLGRKDCASIYRFLAPSPEDAPV